MTYVYVLVAILFLEQLGDWYSTRTILNKGGVEQNAIMATVFKLIGVDTALAIKTIVVPILGYVVGIQSIYVLIGLVLLYVWVLYHNWKSL